MEVSSASMNVASVTVMAITHGLALGFHVSWNESVAAAAAKASSGVVGHAGARGSRVRVSLSTD